MEIIRRNFALKALALAVAIAGWAYFRFAGSSAAGSPAFQQLSIPVNAANLALGYVARFTDREAVVTVENKPRQHRRKARANQGGPRSSEQRGGRV